MTPYERYLDLMRQMREIHVGKNDERAPIIAEIERLLDSLESDVNAFYEDVER